MCIEQGGLQVQHHQTQLPSIASCKGIRPEHPPRAAHEVAMTN